MTLKEELAAKKAELAELKERIEANEAEAIEAGVKLQEEIETKTAEIEQAEKKAALLSVIGKKEEEKTMEEKGIKSLDLASLKANRGAVSTYIKAYNDLEAVGDNKIYDYDKNPVNLMAPLSVRALFGAESISGNALTYYKIGALEGAIGTTSEGQAKARIHIPYTPVTVALDKIAAYLKESDELLSDFAFIESAIRNRGVYEFQKEVENYLIDTLLDTSGVQSGNASISFDNILAAKQDIFADTGYAPDALVINPADWATLLQTKDSNLQYLLGGPAFGPYGNGGYNGNPRIWGLNVIESAAMPQGECCVGAFKAGAAVISKAGEGLRVEVSNSDQDDFIKNIITIRIEERLALAVRVPAAFEVVGTPGGATGAS